MFGLRRIDKGLRNAQLREREFVEASRSLGATSARILMLHYVDTAWWVATFPGLTLVAVVLAVNTIGDALRDALDPRLRYL